MLFRRLSVMLLVSLLLALPAAAKLQLRDGWTKAYVQSNDAALVQKMLDDVGGLLVWKYSQNTLVYVPTLQALVERAKQATVTVSPLQQDELIYVNSRALDPRAGVPAAIPSEQRFESYPPRQKGLYIVQFAGPIESAWVEELRAKGIEQVEPIANRAMIVVATPETIIQIDALPYVQYRDFLHPYLKEGTNVDPFRYFKVSFRLAKVADADAITRSLKGLAVASTPKGECYRGLEVQQVASHPLVINTTVSPSEVDVHGTLPADAPALGDIVVWASGNISEVRFGHVPATFHRLDQDRLQVQVPDLPPGPYNISVATTDGWQQLLQSGDTRGFRVASSYGRTWLSKGDLVLSTYTPSPFFSNAPVWDLRWLSPDGDLRTRRLDDAHMAFVGAAGVINAVGYSRATRFDAFLQPLGNGATVLGNATALSLAANGSAYIARTDAVVHYSGDTVTALATYPLANVRSLDLDSDQCTLVYLAGEMISFHDVCRQVPLGTLTRNSGARAVKFLPDGSILVGGSGLWRLTRDGQVIASIPTAVNAIAIAPDAQSAWLVAGGSLYRYDLLTNQLLSSVPMTSYPSGAIIASIAVYGEWSAARGSALYADDPAIERIVGIEDGHGAQVVIYGRGFVAGATVSIGGVAPSDVRVPSPDSLVFTLPPGTPLDSLVTVTNPNRTKATFSLSPQPPNPSSPRPGKRRAA